MAPAHAEAMLLKPLELGILRLVCFRNGIPV
jgi:hypothetical protein